MQTEKINCDVCNQLADPGHQDVKISRPKAIASEVCAPIAR